MKQLMFVSATFAAGVLLSAVQPGFALAADQFVTLAPAEGWHAVFGDTRLDWPERIHSDRPLDAVLSWTCRLETRTIAQGEAPARGPAGDNDIKIPLALPPVKDGIVLAGQLSLILTTAAGRVTVGWPIFAPVAESSPRGAAIAVLDAALPDAGQAPLAHWIADVLATAQLALSSALIVKDSEWFANGHGRLLARANLCFG